MTTSTSYSNLQRVVPTVSSAASTTVLSERFPWLAPSVQSSPQVEVSVNGVAVVADDDLAEEFAAYADLSEDWAEATWEASSETWPEY